MLNKRLFKLALAAFFGLFLTSGIGSNQADLNRLWGELNSNNQFNLAKQSFCFEKDGQVFGQNIHLKVRPASVTKMYTSFWAIEELGFDYRFQTHFTFDQNNLYIFGGEDSYFVSENLILIMDHLNQAGLSSVKNIFFDSHFKFNWSNDPKEIKKQLAKIFQTNTWKKTEKEAFRNVNNFLYEQEQRSILKPVFSFQNIIYRNELNAPLSADNIIHFSAPLYQQLKPINMYSNNFYTDNLFEFLGGKSAFQDFMYRYFSADENEIVFYTGSGLGENRTTCELTLRLLKSLKEKLATHYLKPMDIMPVAGIDEGTLKKRFTDSAYNQYISAKTGTLRHTSTLAGFVNDESESIFGIFNHTYNIVAARQLQNEFMQYYLDNAQLYELNYVPHDTRSIRNTEIRK